MQVKVCGMRDPGNIEALLKLPVDYLGFIFYPRSPRFAGEKGLENWIRDKESLFGRVKRVGVFVNAEIEDILNKVHDFQLDFVQLHGDESPEYCRELQSFWSISSMRGARLIKAFRVDAAFDFSITDDYSSFCSWFLFDTRGAAYGGTGQTFDWQLLEKYRGEKPFLLSGGIRPGMAVAIRSLDFPRMAGVDINSGFETAPAVKDIELISDFISKLNE